MFNLKKIPTNHGGKLGQEKEGMQQKERVIILTTLDRKNSLVKSCNKNVARTSGLQS